VLVGVRLCYLLSRMWPVRFKGDRASLRDAAFVTDTRPVT